MKQKMIHLSFAPFVWSVYLNLRIDFGNYCHDTDKDFDFLFEENWVAAVK